MHGFPRVKSLSQSCLLKIAQFKSQAQRLLKLFVAHWTAPKFLLKTNHQYPH